MKTATKERPILFSGPMVRAILDGRKTQTRRVIKLGREFGPSTTPGYDWHWRGTSRGAPTKGTWQDMRTSDVLALCPYGKVGERLWVREKHQWSFGDADKIDESEMVREAYRAKQEKRRPNGATVHYAATDKLPWIIDPEGRELGWKPSIHMPRWASRLTLEITDIRVQRLQEISVKEVFAEGVQIPVSASGSPMLQITGKCSPDDYLPEGAIEKGTLKLKDKTAYIRAHFASLWDTINSKGSWEANPFVWALSFRRVES